MTFSYDKLVADRYQTFINLFLYPQGMRHFILGHVTLKDGQKILDAGCGTGIISRAMAEKGARENLSHLEQYAFDISPAMLEVFRSACNFPVDLRRLDVRTLPYPENHFDLILTAAMLEYVPNIAEALSSLKRTLKSGGLMYIFMSRKSALNDLLFRPFGKPRCYSPRELTSILKGIGFSNIHRESFGPAFFWLNLWGFILKMTK
jgi:ubiquinone/menaquinone biosynthesis C-methylase UbiE